MLLCTDLDGTFLGGRQSDRMRLYRLIRERDDIGLVFVTGRAVESIIPLLSDPTVPNPDYIIGDIGATVVDGELRQVQPLQSAIDAMWPGTSNVLERLGPLDGKLERQTVPQERRCSFYTDDEGLIAEVGKRVAELGCTIVHSASKYLDVLPVGVNKGTTLRKLLDQLGVSLDDALVAGDTLNDEHLYEVGCRGVVVGNAEKELVKVTENTKDTLHSDRPGAAGILHAMQEFGWIESTEGATDEFADDKRGSQLVIVYHRLPYEEHKDESGNVVRSKPKSPNGIIPTLLGLFREGRAGAWVAWTEQPNRNPKNFEKHQAVDSEEYPYLLASLVPLTRKDVNLFYKTFSKEAFWPIIFSFISRAKFRQDHWEHFLEVNELFARHAAEEADEDATVWIHDYNLWMVPAFLRRMRPELKIAFFHHTAFPPPDVFNVIPWRREILGSLLQCDYVGFHIPRYAANFAAVAHTHSPVTTIEKKQSAPRFLTFGCALGEDSYASALEVGDRVVHLGAHPVGLDVTRLRDLLQESSIRDHISELQEELAGVTTILSVERLDYVKGQLEKLDAFERLLEEHPELHGKVRLINICTPASAGMTIYKATESQINEVVGRINGRFSTLDWTPVRHFLRSLPFEGVLAHYAASDIAWITPLRDGLNLVAKEFVATKGTLGDVGTLVLSEFAGAAVELHGALLTNPFDSREMTKTLYDAITLDENEKHERLQRMFDIVKGYDVRAWTEEFLSAIPD